MRFFRKILYAVLVFQTACGPYSLSISSAPVSDRRPPGSSSGPAGGTTPPTGIDAPPTVTTPVPVIAPPVVVVAPPPIVAPGVIEIQGIFAYERKPAGAALVIRYLRNNVDITRDEFITLLGQADAIGKDFRELLNLSIANLPPPGGGRQGYELKGPVINNATKNFPFYFVAIEKGGLGAGANTYADYLFNCNPQPNGAVKNPQFTARFLKFYAAQTPINFLEEGPLSNNLLNYGASVFQGGLEASPKEILVSPCPEDARMNRPQNNFLGHIYIFAQGVKDAAVFARNLRLHSFWYAVGKIARDMFDGANVTDAAGAPENKLFLSTHGTGVNYLHFRLENAPPNHNYAANVDALRDEAGSQAYFQAIFP